ncbi:dihydroorotate dehydrogenase [Thermodesulfobacteriota bacterium]
MVTTADLAVDLNGLALANPVMTASGTAGNGRELGGLLDLRRLGAFVVKGVSMGPREGNPPPRIVETSAGLLNAIGLQNPGADAFVNGDMPYLSDLGIPIIVNIYGSDEDEYAEVARTLEGVEGVSGVEVNISCPNVRMGGLAFGTDPSAAARLVETVRAEFSRHLMVKLSPNVTDIVEIAKAVEEAGADSVSLINTLLGMAIDSETRRPMLANVVGGLSGPAIKPVALRMVWQVASALSVPVVGVGGIMSAADAVEFIIAGASAIQVGTATFVNPAAVLEVIDGIADYLDRHAIANLRELVGSLVIED